MESNLWHRLKMSLNLEQHHCWVEKCKHCGASNGGCIKINVKCAACHKFMFQEVEIIPYTVWGYEVKHWGNVKGIATNEKENMTERDFCYWLQGFFELNKPESLTVEQTTEVRKHLYNVFQHDCENIKMSPVTREFYVEDTLNHGYGVGEKQYYELPLEETRESLVGGSAPKVIVVYRDEYGNPPASC